jgi:hypothetical protein
MVVKAILIKLKIWNIWPIFQNNETLTSKYDLIGINKNFCINMSDPKSKICSHINQLLEWVNPGENQCVIIEFC